MLSIDHFDKTCRRGNTNVTLNVPYRVSILWCNNKHRGSEKNCYFNKRCINLMGIRSIKQANPLVNRKHKINSLWELKCTKIVRKSTIIEIRNGALLFYNSWDALLPIWTWNASALTDSPWVLQNTISETVTFDSFNEGIYMSQIYYQT